MFCRMPPRVYQGTVRCVTACWWLNRARFTNNKADATDRLLGTTPITTIVCVRSPMPVFDIFNNRTRIGSPRTHELKSSGYQRSAKHELWNPGGASVAFWLSGFGQYSAKIDKPGHRGHHVHITLHTCHTAPRTYKSIFDLLCVCWRPMGCLLACHVHPG